MEEKKYAFDYGKLRGRIVEKFDTAGKFVTYLPLKMVRETLSLKLNNKSDFSQTEIMAFCDTLEIPYEEIPVYFFDTKGRDINTE